MIWKLIFYIAKFMKECKEDKINAYAAQSAFFILLAIIPFLMVFLSLLKYTPITESMLLSLYEEGLPGYISPFFISITDEVYTRSFGITAVSAIVAIWSAAKGMHALTDGLNVVNDLEENRNWFVLRFWSIVNTIPVSLETAIHSSNSSLDIVTGFSQITCLPCRIASIEISL